MKSVILFMPYYGKLINYFDIWLSAVEMNSSIDFCLVTDLISEKRILPSNVKLLNLPYEVFRQRIQEKFEFRISLENLVRISQFRPALAYIFPEIVKEYEYWGYIECDLIPGDIRHFLTDDVLENYEKIFKLGHFQVFRNNERMNTLFMREYKSALSYRFAFSKNILFFEELLGMHNIAQAAGVSTYTENVFSDIKTVSLPFQRSQYSYNDVPSDGNCIFEFKNGKLYEYSYNSQEIKKREVLYAHFQKREMKVCVDNHKHYLIVPNKFIPWQKISEDFLQKLDVETSAVAYEYKKKKEKVLSMAGKQRYKELCWWQLKLIRWRVANYGGADLTGK